MHWNHRLIEHRDSSNPDHEVYTTVHEVYYNDSNEKYLWSPREASPRTREDAERFVRAFDKPPVLWVDDASIVFTANLSVDYKEWGWL